MWAIWFFFWISTMTAERVSLHICFSKVKVPNSNNWITRANATFENGKLAKCYFHKNYTSLASFTFFKRECNNSLYLWKVKLVRKLHCCQPQTSILYLLSLNKYYAHKNYSLKIYYFIITYVITHVDWCGSKKCYRCKIFRWNQMTPAELLTLMEISNFFVKTLDFLWFIRVESSRTLQC